MEIGVVTTLVTLGAIAFLLWFALGTQHNISRGNRVLKWLQLGLPSLGRRTSLRWLGSSAVRLNISNAEAPYREAEVVVVLEPRDVGWLWAWSRRTGRRDFLILRGRLRHGARFEVEAGDARAWTGGERLQRLEWAAWREVDWGIDGVRVAASADADPSVVRRWWGEFESVAGATWRISVRREAPHVEVHVLLPDLATADARRLIGAFLGLGRDVERR